MYKEKFIVEVTEDMICISSKKTTEMRYPLSTKSSFFAKTKGEQVAEAVENYVNTFCD